MIVNFYMKKSKEERHRLPKCIAVHYINTIPRVGDSVVVKHEGGALTVESVMWDLPNQQVEIRVAGFDEENEYPEVK